MVNMVRRVIAFLPLAALLVTWAPAQAQQSTPQVFEAVEEQAIKEIVRQYLLDHPEVMIESLQASQAPVIWQWRTARRSRKSGWTPTPRTRKEGAFAAMKGESRTAYSRRTPPRL